jgi:hypothetical protein
VSHFSELSKETELTDSLPLLEVTLAQVIAFENVSLFLSFY